MPGSTCGQDGLGTVSHGPGVHQQSSRAAQEHFAHAGIRHLMWDHGKIGNQAAKDSMFELDEVKKSSEAILYGSAGLSALLALYYYTV
jgi:hypothetical protein